MIPHSNAAPECVFVTGASSGFGAVLARRFIGRGARVIMAARRIDRLEALARELGERALAIQLDVRDNEAIQRAVALLPAHFYGVDCVVNNAGLALGLSPAASSDADQWSTMIETNCKGVAQVTRVLLPGMIERGRGHVVNIGSVAGSYPYPGGNVYGATKAFVHQFSLNCGATWPVLVCAYHASSPACALGQSSPKSDLRATRKRRRRSTPACGR